MTTFRGISAALFLALLAAPVIGSAAYLAPPTLSAAKLLPPPPSGPSQAHDLFEVAEWQTRRKPEDCDRANRAKHVTLHAFVYPDGPLSATEFKTFDPFFEEIRAEAEKVIEEGKNYWQRPRPFLTSDAIHYCAKRESKKASFSYPSGHATLGRLYALILMDLEPKLKDELLARGDQIALDRVRAGVHYPSDIAAGKKLGDAIYASMKKNPEFRRKLAQLKSQ